MIDREDLLDRCASVVDLEGEIFHLGFTRTIMAVTAAMFLAIGCALGNLSAFGVGAIAAIVGVVVHFVILEDKRAELLVARKNLDTALGRLSRN